MKTRRAGAKTLLFSIIMSSPGPLVVGLSLLGGHSSTQTADFIRRTTEFLAIVMSYVVYTRITKHCLDDAERRRTLETRSNLFVGIMMCIGGTVMLVLTLFLHDNEKGNVLPGLIIAILSATGNAFFWRKYTTLSSDGHRPILSVQARLYRAKTLIDLSVCAALIPVLIFPDATVTLWIDTIGSLIVALYLIRSGARTVYEQCRRPLAAQEESA